MAGLPVPVPDKSLHDKILCIPDLEVAGSKKLTNSARGKRA